MALGRINPVSLLGVKEIACMTLDSDRRGSYRPGEQAERPTEVPARGWWQITRRAVREASTDHVPMLAAGVAFFGFLAIPPALIAVLTVYGLIADPNQVAYQINTLAGALPSQAQPLVADQLREVASSSGRGLGVGLLVSLLGALWSASAGMSNLIKAVNIAYDEQETRGFLKLRAVGLTLTLGGVVFVVVTVALVAAVPALLDALPLGIVGTVLAQLVRWVLLIFVVVGALAVIYRLAPDRDDPKFGWATPGALVAVVLWLLGSVGFSLYVNNFGSYNKTYGALAGVVVFLLWLYLTSYIVLLGAEINAEAEKQTRSDTTTGPAVPMGERRAVAADTLAEPATPPKKR
jgi:membrane protein